MTPEQEALGRRAVACPGWRWLRGCPWERPPSGAPDDGGDRGITDGANAPPDGALPDLSEPAAVGCVEALACDALGTNLVHVSGIYTDWVVRNLSGFPLCPNGNWDSSRPQSGRYAVGRSKVGAWVAALEAAGRK